MNLDKLFTQALVTQMFGKGEAPPEMAVPAYKSGKAPGAKERAEAKRARKAARR
jgi:hypothetical protein